MGRSTKRMRESPNKKRSWDSSIRIMNHLGGKCKKDTGQVFTRIQDALFKDPQLSIRKACHLHRASRSGYYKWKKRPAPVPSAIGLDIDLKDMIQKIVLKFPEYGYRRVTTELKNRGYVVNHKRVLRIMRDNNLLCLTNNSH